MATKGRTKVKSPSLDYCKKFKVGTKERIACVAKNKAHMDKIRAESKANKAATTTLLQTQPKINPNTGKVSYKGKDISKFGKKIK